MTSTADLYNLHNLILGVDTADLAVRNRLRAVFAPFRCTTREPDVLLRLRSVQSLPPWQPAGEIVSESRLLTCALEGDLLTAHFPRWGTVSVDLGAGTIEGDLFPEEPVATVAPSLSFSIVIPFFLAIKTSSTG